MYDEARTPQEGGEKDLFHQNPRAHKKVFYVKETSLDRQGKSERDNLEWNLQDKKIMKKL